MFSNWYGAEFHSASAGNKVWLVYKYFSTLVTNTFQHFCHKSWSLSWSTGQLQYWITTWYRTWYLDLFKATIFSRGTNLTIMCHMWSVFLFCYKSLIMITYNLNAIFTVLIMASLAQVVTKTCTSFWQWKWCKSLASSIFHVVVSWG